MKPSICGMTVLLAIAAAALPAVAQEKVALDLNIDGSPKRVIIELDEGSAPKSAANFRKLVGSGYYNGLAVHRAIPNYLIQLGDPHTKDPDQKHLWGTGGPDYTVPAELGAPMERGAVAMARLPDARNPSKASNGSQFFVALDRLPSLDGTYTVFGRVVSGIEHLDTIASLTTDTNDVPIKRVEVASATAFSGDTAPSTSDADGAILSGVAGGVKGAGSTVMGAGSKVRNVIPDGIPLIGRDRKEAGTASAPQERVPIENVEIAGSGEKVVDPTDSRTPPEFDLLEDEIAATNMRPASPNDPVEPLDLTATEEVADPAPGRTRDAGEEEVEVTASTDAEVGNETEGKKRRKLLFLPVPDGEPKEDSDKGALTRFVERIW